MAQAAYAYSDSRADQVDLSKTVYRAIVKILHPDNNLGENVYDISFLYKANEFYKSGNYEGLEKIYDYLMNPRSRRTASSQRVVSTDNMKSFFASKGLEVIDKRSKGGALWVVGAPEEINSIVREACRMFGAGGNYAMNGGRSTGYRTAWFTHCNR